MGFQSSFVWLVFVYGLSFLACLQGFKAFSAAYGTAQARLPRSSETAAPPAPLPPMLAMTKI
jgi:hypothetical protein